MDALFTFEICDVHPEFVALLQYRLSSSLDEFVESHSELRHAFSQVIESKIDAW